MVIGGLASIGDQQVQNEFFASPNGATGYPQFRTMVVGDLPTAIPNANLQNSGSNDLLAIQILGSAIKGYVPGNVYPAQNAAFNLANNNVRWGAIIVPVGGVLTGIKVLLTVSGIFTATSYNGAALYSINPATGLLTQLAAATSSTTFLQGSAGLTNIPFSAPLTVIAGVYCCALVTNWSALTTAPQLASYGMSSLLPTYDFANSIKVIGQGTGPTLPATIASSGIAVTVSTPLFYVY